LVVRDGGGKGRPLRSHATGEGQIGRTLGPRATPVGRCPFRDFSSPVNALPEGVNTGIRPGSHPKGDRADRGRTPGKTARRPTAPFPRGKEREPFRGPKTRPSAVFSRPRLVPFHRCPTRVYRALPRIFRSIRKKDQNLL